MPTTDRLYYDSPTTRAFEARVVRCEPRGERVAVWLDRTAFYPTSGGQPHDLGTLGACSVVDVQDDDDGNVMHLVAGTAPADGALVTGHVDWTRRFDHMQQHTGQHLLSAVIEHAFQARTLSFHLGADSSTIDLDRELTAGQLGRAEAAANEAVWDDVPVSIRYATEDEARALPLRKETTRSGTLRLIEIQGLDLSACGGTHVASTGALGQVAIVSAERFKGGQRLEFLCGRRALARFQLLREASAASIRLLSVLPSDLPGAIERLQGELKAQKRALGAAQLELANHEAIAMAATAESLGGARVVLRAVDGDAARLKALSSAIVAGPGLTVVLVSAQTPALVVAARSADVGTACHELVGLLVKTFGGRGGGKPDFAQCGAIQASPEHVMAAARDWLVSHA